MKQKIDIPVVILANEDFVTEEDIHKRNQQFVKTHEVEYIIWKDAHHLHQSDVGFVNGNFLGIMKNSNLSREQL